jgi:hypothetical protein
MWQNEIPEMYFRPVSFQSGSGPKKRVADLLRIMYSRYMYKV